MRRRGGDSAGRGLRLDCWVEPIFLVMSGGGDEGTGLGWLATL